MRYRDTKTGKFVSASTWRRSRARGGKRYKRVRRSVVKSTPKRRKAKRTTSPAAPPPEAPFIPAEFLSAADDYFESGYEAEEEEEYA